MKRIRINSGKIGLVLRNGEFKRALTRGMHWIFPTEKVIRFDLTHPFSPPSELSHLLNDKKLAKWLEILEVGDQEIVLSYVNGSFREILTAGTYAFWKSETSYMFVSADLRKTEIDLNVDKTILARPELRQYLRVFTVESHEKGILYVDGWFERILLPGTYYFWNNTTPIRVEKVDIGQKLSEIPAAEVFIH